MARNADQLVEISFNGLRRMRYFTFLPRVGDKVEVNDLDPEVFWVLEVEKVIFGHDQGEDEMSVTIRCDVLHRG